MTQNQSGKQLFEWVKGTTFPKEEGDYVCRWADTKRLFLSKYRHDLRNWLTISNNDLCDIEWLDESPAQPSTGKQLPTDEEIFQAALQEDDGSYSTRGFEAGAKWMRERAQGESDKWISVEDERKPEPNVYVLVHNYNGYEIAEYRERDNTFRIGYDLVRNVTYWQPLPSAPTQRGENNENDKM